VQTVFDFCRREPQRAIRPERLFFALMPEEDSALQLARFAEQLILENDLPATPVKPARIHIALHRLGSATRAALYGAKLAGQAVAAAGLTLRFEAITSLTGGGRRLALVSEDKLLLGVQALLDAALQRNGLQPREAPLPHITLAYGAARLEPQPVAPIAVTVSGLALLRGEAEDFQVLRRWPLNKPRSLAPIAAAPILSREAAKKPKRKAGPPSEKKTMPITVYGIKNCDTMKKAFTWLESHGIAYDFHDYKKAGVTKAQLSAWCKAAGWEKVINRAGPSFRKLPDADKEDLNQAKAIALMLGNPSMIKRPVLENGATLEIGFKPERYGEIFKTK